MGKAWKGYSTCISMGKAWKRYVHVRAWGRPEEGTSTYERGEGVTRETTSRSHTHLVHLCVMWCALPLPVQDYHLAKRYYDLAAESSTEAYVPASMALFKLNFMYTVDSYKDVRREGGSQGERGEGRGRGEPGREGGGEEGEGRREESQERREEWLASDQ